MSGLSKRLTDCNEAPIQARGDYVLYWMITQRRLTWNFGLQAAVKASVKLNKPLVIFEPLRLGYRWSSPRFHQFIVEGMLDNAALCSESKALYFPYVEEREGDGRGLLQTLGSSACQIFTDEFPCFFLPRMVRAAAAQLPVRLTQVDSNGILPLRAAERHFTTAYSFRRELQKTLPTYLSAFPCPEPLDALSVSLKPQSLSCVYKNWRPSVPESLLEKQFKSFSFQHQTPPAVLRGGSVAAQAHLQTFLESRLHRYDEDRNKTIKGAASGLSPYLHFGHISPHEILNRILSQCSWTPEKLGTKATGSRHGWWGLPSYAEALVDQLITWRELGYVFNFHNPDTYDQFDSLPAWAKDSMEKHRDDPRPETYNFEELEQGRTQDPLWNAAQRQLRTEGVMHNYLRMLWGKKIYQWSANPETALETLIELNNRFALDGRNPNSYSGIFWTLGRFDRAWGPERPIFGKLRYMTSASTARKLKPGAYIDRYGGLEGTQ